jgi:hypothetical protein
MLQSYYDILYIVTYYIRFYPFGRLPSYPSPDDRQTAEQQNADKRVPCLNDLARRAYLHVYNINMSYI